MNKIKTYLASLSFLSLGFVSYVAVQEAAEPEPYDQVEVVALDYVGEDGYVLVADFMKNRCDFKLLEIWVKRFGRWRMVEYRDTDGSDRPDDDPETGNRPLGQQRLSIVIDTAGARVGRMELNTRHHCPNSDGVEIIDKTFVKLKG